jgi:hypothetical protein
VEIFLVKPGVEADVLMNFKGSGCDTPLTIAAVDTDGNRTKSSSDVLSGIECNAS